MREVCQERVRWFFEMRPLGNPDGDYHGRARHSCALVFIQNLATFSDYFANSCPNGKSGDTIGLRPDYPKAAYKDELVGRGIVREIIRLTATGCFGFLVDPDNAARKHLHWDTACNLTALATFLHPSS